MIDLVWNFPLLEQQAGIWAKYLEQATADYSQRSVESLRPSFRTVDTTLRERAATLLGHTPDRTWLTCGNHHGTLVALLASGLAGTHVALEAVSYPGIINQCRFTRTQMTGIAYDGDGMLPDALRTACEAAQAEGKSIRGVITMASVQNPLGFVMPLERRAAIVSIAREFDLALIVDDAYGYLAGSDDTQPTNFATLAPERTWFVRGLAKSFAPGARTGFLVAPASAADTIQTAMVATATGTEVPANLAALAMCEDGTVDRLMADKRTEGAARNSAARTMLAEAGCPAHPGAPSAWHLWVPLPSALAPAEVVKAMAAEDVLLSSGKFCEVTPGAAHGVRIALGGEIDRDRTLEGVSRLADWLNTA